MKVDLSAEGFREIDNLLADLEKAVAKPIVKRALTEQLKPVADMANALWSGADDRAFSVSTKARHASRAVRTGSSVTVYTGATKFAPHAHLLEYGTAPRYHKSGKYVGAVAPQPVLWPAWEANKDAVLQGLAEEIRNQIIAAAERRVKRGR